MFPDWQWTILSLPPRHFSWRVRGNPLYWALEERSTLAGEYDRVIATSMVDLATLRGLVPGLAQFPTVLYFHENQFAFPQDRQRHSLLEAQMVSLYSALAADRLVFNSRYNQQSFFDGLTALLQRLPDKVPAGIIDGLREKSSILPVPLMPVGDAGSQPGTLWPGASEPGQYPVRPLRVLWVGRFEHDKGGKGLLLTLRHLEQSALNFELAVIGQQFRDSPEVFAQIQGEFSHRLVQFGYLDSISDYRQFLADADIVLSTADHEFQGLAVLEAVAAGCLPAVPERLVYPEIFPAEYCYSSSPENPVAEARGAAELIGSLAKQLASGRTQVPDVTRFGQSVLKAGYETLLLTAR